jgi:hypothetical protein
MRVANDRAEKGGFIRSLLPAVINSNIRWGMPIRRSAVAGA